MGEYPPLTGPWLFPTATYWLIPLLITFVLWCVLLIEHLMYANSTNETHKLEDAESVLDASTPKGWEIRFQALYVRIVLVFPIFSVLAFIGAYFPWLSHWMEFVGVFLEAYVLFGFFAFLSGLAYMKAEPGTFPASLLESKWSNRPIRCCGAKFTTGEGALSFFFYAVAQFVVVKPTLVLITAIIVFRTGREPPQAAKVVMNVISALSIFIATFAVLRVYKALKTQRPSSVMEGHNGLIKIGVVKLLFIFIVLNNLILRNLASSDKLPIPATICAPATISALPEYREFCEQRMINVIFLIEIVICVIPAVASYRHHGLGLRHSLRCARVPRFLALVFFNPFDLRLFWNNRLRSSEATGIQNEVTVTA